MKYRIAHTDRIRAINDRSRAAGYHAVLDPDEIDDLEPGGWHVVLIYARALGLVRVCWRFQLRDGVTVDAPLVMSEEDFVDLPEVEREDMAGTIWKSLALA